MSSQLCTTLRFFGWLVGWLLACLLVATKLKDPAFVGRLGKLKYTQRYARYHVQ